MISVKKKRSFTDVLWNFWKDLLPAVYDQAAGAFQSLSRERPMES